MKRKPVTEEQFKSMILREARSYDIQTTSEARSIVMCLADQYLKVYKIQQQGGDSHGSKSVMDRSHYKNDR